MTDSRPYQSKSGYTGALVLLLLAFGNYFFVSHFSISLDIEQQLTIIVALTILAMLCHEWFQNRHSGYFKIEGNNRPNQRHLWLSSLSRYIVYLGLISIPWFFVSHHYYFQDASFNSTRLFYLYLLYLYLLFGFPYIYLTLRYKGHFKYEFNDYAILTLIAIRALVLFSSNKTHFYYLKNRRIKKIILVFLVNFFFLSLMTKFLMLEYNGFANALNQITADSFNYRSFFRQYHSIYLMLFHLIFVVDVGLAIIGYSIASRWLDNRTKSVDMSLYGWFVVLLCYPPMNSGFTDQFIGYGRFQTEQLITSELGLMVIMPLILACFFIYVWATAALGFKFSNLTNRGIIRHGPYGHFRHPAYTAKNLAWWIDNTHVLTNVWAASSLLIWNLIYILRGITEEKHLQQDPAFRHYQKIVPYRFLPGSSPRWSPGWVSKLKTSSFLKRNE